MKEKWQEFQPAFIGGVFKKQSFLRRGFILLKSFLGIKTEPEFIEQKILGEYKQDNGILSVRIFPKSEKSINMPIAVKETKVIHYRIG